MATICLCQVSQSNVFDSPECRRDKLLVQISFQTTNGLDSNLTILIFMFYVDYIYLQTTFIFCVDYTYVQGRLQLSLSWVSFIFFLEHIYLLLYSGLYLCFMWPIFTFRLYQYLFIFCVDYIYAYCGLYLSLAWAMFIFCVDYIYLQTMFIFCVDYIYVQCRLYLSLAWAIFMWVITWVCRAISLAQ